MTHPLTDAELHDKFNGYREEGWCNSIYDPDDMRAAADWQLDRVLDWLDKNLRYYTDDTYLGTCKPFYELTGDIEEAMRPTQVSSGREGAFQALDRLCEENFDGLRRLAQEDN